MPSSFKLMECNVMNILVGFGETLELRRYLLKYTDVLDVVLRSLLRKLIVRGEVIKDTGESEEMCLYNTETLIELISNTTYAICK